MEIKGWIENPCTSCSRQKYPNHCNKHRSCKKWREYFGTNWNLARQAYIVSREGRGIKPDSADALDGKGLSS